VNAFNPNYRRIGIESYGHSDDDSLNWQIGAFELQDVKGIGQDVGDPLHFSFNTRVSGTPWYDEGSGGRGYLHLGISNMYASTAPGPSVSGNNGDLASFSVRPELQTTSSWLDTGTILGATHFNVTGLESVLNLGSLQLQGEYLTTVVNRPADADLNFHGGYVQAAYFLTGEHESWDRETGRLARPKPFENFFLVRTQDGRIGYGWGAWQVAARWSYLSLSDKDIRGGREENVTLGLNWYWTAYSKVMFNLVEGRIHDRAPVNGYSGGSFTGLGVRVLMDF
jgi:phosphate-selective porin OprO/OprP